MLGTHTGVEQILGLRSYPDLHLLSGFLHTGDVLLLQLAVLAALHRRQHGTDTGSNDGYREFQEVGNTGVFAHCWFLSGK